ncbi:1650_t:CDS:2 [Dentiscutata heterogama]|uniref:1650_t:CDS:1 n=1 Tax=Dentiscutata heterogama TaxID=1316150 RepID=A0ACA9K2W7_9GLOM|nr:1650_t:CDS:2 [Dentiscutata heterogama]
MSKEEQSTGTYERSDFIDATKFGLYSIADIVGSYIPIVSEVVNIVKKIDETFKKAQRNKNICLILLERAKDAETVMNKILNYKDDYEEFLRKEESYKSFHKFKNLLIRIKEFVAEVSELKSARMFFDANNVKNMYDRLTDEFEICMKELHFEIMIYFEIMNEKIDVSNQDIQYIKKLMTKNLGDEIHAPHIDPSELSEQSHERRGKNLKIVKKFYKQTCEVACKPIKDFEKFQTELMILGKLNNFPNILIFYGLSKIDNHDVMILEWATYGTLRELYDKYDITWRRKVQIVLDICRGLTFLHKVNIVHHDVRCDNVLINRDLVPKITNFRFARMTTANITMDLSEQLNNVVRWMAPEQIERYQNNDKKAGYTIQAEIFSFGMLIWELCYETKPYKDKNFMEISNHVLKGKRETLKCGKLLDQEIQLEFIKIIVHAWQQDPYNRIRFDELFLKLNDLSEKYPIPPGVRGLLNDKTLDLDGSRESENKKLMPPDPDELLIDLDTPIKSIVSLEEGVKLHQEKDYQNAWKYFSVNAEVGDHRAKYWQGYYYEQGYFVKEDKTRANQLYKEAADYGVADAQYRYACSLYKKENLDHSEFLRYLNMAAENGHALASYYLGKIYLNGECGVKMDKQFGLKYLRSAALNDNKQAIDFPDEQYALAQTTKQSPYLESVHEKTVSLSSKSHQMVSSVQGTFLKFLVQISKATRVLEIGTFTGYSALFMAEGLKERGLEAKVVTLEKDIDHFKVAKENIESSGLGHLIEMKLGNAIDTLSNLDNSVQYDLIFIDADKGNYINYYNTVLERNLLSDDGIIVADNGLIHFSFRVC